LAGLAALRGARCGARVRGEPEPQTQEEYRAIALRYLPNILSARKTSTRS
jgi:hypothetical protein